MTDPTADQLLAQERMLPVLLDPAFYPHNPERVRLIQTHASFVFLAPPFVYKIKKPVNFGFLDFSTLEKRRHFCQREVELNRRLARDVYLGVVAISWADGGFRFGAAGEIVEYAVKMRLLCEGGFLDQRLARGEVGESDLDRIVERLSDFYASQHPSAEVEAHGRIPALRVSTDENFSQTREFAGRTLSGAAYEAISSYTERCFMVHEALFEERVRERRILDCHGDLHLEHIHLTPDALNIYDCIEFNDRFRYVDAASDSAFLAMDLDFRDRPDLSRYLVSGLAGKMGDPRMGRLVDFYKCYRAYVRGKVESFHSVAHAAPAEEREACAEKARRYFRLSLRYAVAGSEPLVLVIMGRVASPAMPDLAGMRSASPGTEPWSSGRVRIR
jgi:aminoglycoside phosphotransferase family enzyme